MTQPIKNGFLATYLHCSMAGSYFINCTIHGWDDKSERFMLRYHDPVLDEVVNEWVPYDYVWDWTWPNLSKHFAEQNWE